MAKRVLHLWAADSMTRIYKKTKPGKEQTAHLDLGLRDRGSFQVGFQAEGFAPKLEVKVDAPPGLEVRVREVGYVMLANLNTDTPATEQDGADVVPGFVPDPLFDIKDGFVRAYPEETGALWVTVKTSADTAPGPYEINVTVFANGNEAGTISASVDVFPVDIAPEHYPWTAHWFYPNCIYEWHGLEPFEEKTWELLRKYMQNLWDHGNNILNTFLWTMPVNGEMGYYQLLRVKKVGEDQYRFDWSNVDRWVNMAKEIGFRRFLWPHLFSQWGAKHPPVIYDNYDDPNHYEGRELWPKETAGTDPVYRRFLEQFLPEFKAFLDKHDIYEGSLYHLSDEPLNEEEMLRNYRNGKAMVKEIAPWMNKFMDGINHVEYAEEGMTDIPISGLQVAHEFQARNLPHCSYFCCGPRGEWLNRLMDTPLAKIRGSGWLVYFLKSLGLMHWGYNYWYQICKSNLINPYSVTHGHDYPMIPHGDCYEVYPGDDGPVDSIRWEVFSESIIDNALLSAAGVDKNDPYFTSAFAAYNIFPKHAGWYKTMRRQILSGNFSKS